MIIPAAYRPNTNKNTIRRIILNAVLSVNKNRDSMSKDQMINKTFAIVFALEYSILNHLITG